MGQEISKCLNVGTHNSVSNTDDEETGSYEGYEGEICPVTPGKYRKLDTEKDATDDDASSSSSGQGLIEITQNEHVGTGDDGERFKGKQKKTKTKNAEQDLKKRGNSSSGYGGSENTQSSLEQDSTTRRLLGKKAKEFSLKLSDVASSSGNISRKQSVTSSQMEVPVIRFRHSVDASSRRGLRREDEFQIIKNFCFIVDELEADDVIDVLISTEDLDEDEREFIMKEGTRANQVRALLLKILQFRQSSFPNVIKAFRDAGYQHVVDRMDDVNNEEDTLSTLETDTANLRNILRNYKPTIMNQMRPDRILDFFLQEKVIGVQEYSSIWHKKNPMEQSTSLFKRIEKYLPKSYAVLLKALMETRTTFLLDLLQKAQTGLPVIIDQRVQGHRVIAERRPLSITDDNSNEPPACITITCTSGDETVDSQLLEYLSTERGRLDAADTFSLAFGLLYEHSKEGSVVICLRCGSKDSYHNLLEACESGRITDVLRELYSRMDISKFTGQKQIHLEVTAIWSEKEDNFNGNKEGTPATKNLSEDTLDRFKARVPLLVEELDAISLVKPLFERKVLTKEEADTIVTSKPTLRRNRTQRLMDVIYEKGVGAIAVFVDVVKHKRKETLVDGILHTRNKEINGKVSPEQTKACCCSLKCSQVHTKNIFHGYFVFNEQTPSESHSVPKCVFSAVSTDESSTNEQEPLLPSSDLHFVSIHVDTETSGHGTRESSGNRSPKPSNNLLNITPENKRCSWDSGYPDSLSSREARECLILKPEDIDENDDRDSNSLL